MATFRHREEFLYFFEQRTKTSRPPPPPPTLHKRTSSIDAELRHLPRGTNIIMEHDILFFDKAAATVGGAGEARARGTIDCKKAAELYGGISIIDYWVAKKPAPPPAPAFRFRN